MSELTVHTGLAGEHTMINVSWFDHNGVTHLTPIEVIVCEHDKPRTVEIWINGIRVGILNSDHQVVVLEDHGKKFSDQHQKMRKYVVQATRLLTECQFADALAILREALRSE